MVSASSTSQTLPQTLLEAKKHVASPMALAIKVRRSMPSFLDFSSAICPIRNSTSFCFWLCGRGMNSSLDRTCVGIGESTPFLRSRWNLRIHIVSVPLLLTSFIEGHFSANSLYQGGAGMNSFQSSRSSDLKSRAKRGIHTVTKVSAHHSRLTPSDDL